jgi:hypothetical protein
LPPLTLHRLGLPIHHSRRGSKNILFLDFDGDIGRNKEHGGWADYDGEPSSIVDDLPRVTQSRAHSQRVQPASRQSRHLQCCEPSSVTDVHHRLLILLVQVEKGQITLIYSRVAEDYAPFDIDVTTGW